MRRKAKVAIGVLGIVFVLFAEMSLIYKMGHDSAIISQMR